MLPVVMFTLASICSMHNHAFSSNAPQETINTKAKNTVLTKEDITSFEIIAENIKAFMYDTQKTLDQFIDDKDKTPYAMYINKFNAQLILLETTVIVPLKKKIADTRNSSLPAEYKEALNVTESILTALKSHIVGVVNILKDTKFTNPKNKTAGIQMATALGKYAEQLSKDHQKLDAQLDTLHNYLLKLELVNLAKTIALVRQELKRKKEEQSKPLSFTQKAQIVRIISQKLNQK